MAPAEEVTVAIGDAVAGQVLAVDLPGEFRQEVAKLLTQLQPALGEGGRDLRAMFSAMSQEYGSDSAKPLAADVPKSREEAAPPLLSSGNYATAIRIDAQKKTWCGATRRCVAATVISTTRRNQWPPGRGRSDSAVMRRLSSPAGASRARLAARCDGARPSRTELGHALALPFRCRRWCRSRGRRRARGARCRWLPRSGSAKYRRGRRGSWRRVAQRSLCRWRRRSLSLRPRCGRLR